jgi:hypothetical protein
VAALEAWRLGSVRRMDGLQADAANFLAFNGIQKDVFVFTQRPSGHFE